MLKIMHTYKYNVSMTKKQCSTYFLLLPTYGDREVLRVCTSRPSAQTQPLLTSIYILRWCKDFAIFCFQWARYIRMIYTDIYIYINVAHVYVIETHRRAPAAAVGALAWARGPARKATPASPEAGRGSGGEVYIQTGDIYIYIDTRTPPPLNIAPVDASALLARARAPTAGGERLRTLLAVFGPSARRSSDLDSVCGRCTVFGRWVSSDTRRESSDDRASRGCLRTVGALWRAQDVYTHIRT